MIHVRDLIFQQHPLNLQSQHDFARHIFESDDSAERSSCINSYREKI